MFKYIVLLLVFVSQCAAKCHYYEYVITCTSLQDLHDVDWNERNTYIHVKIQNGEKLKINDRILTSIPNVQTLIFDKSVNDIQEFTFNVKSNLKNIQFRNCDLPVIKKNWFSFNSDNNVTIAIESSKVNSFEPNCFEGSKNLYHFWMQNNNISRINVNVFNGTSFTILYLVRNEIQLIEDGAFANMPYLEKLYLYENFLTSFNTKLILNNVPNLLQLQLGFNKIKSITENDFISFKKLREIEFPSNELEWIQDGAFNGLKNLESLNLAYNKLSSFSERTLPYNGLPSLEQLGLRHNRLNNLPRSFVLYFPKLKEISIFGNPWQCACYTHIVSAITQQNVSIQCADEHSYEERPVCIVPISGGDKCVENLQDASELYETFSKELKEHKVNSGCY